MFQWRVKLQEARQAVRAGQLDDACRLLAEGELKEFRPAKKLAGDLAGKFAERAAQRIAWGESSAGFADLARVEQLGGRGDRVATIRREYARHAGEEALARLRAGEPDAALKSLMRAARRGVDSPELRTLRAAAEPWSEALRAAERGDMVVAEAELLRAARVVSAAAQSDTIGLCGALEADRAQTARRAAEHAAARTALEAAVIAKKWSEALRAADRAQAAAPKDPVVAGLRRRAWRELELDKTRVFPVHPNGERPPVMNQPQPPRGARALADAIRNTSAAPGESEEETVSGRAPADRRMLWIDAVGGYLICLDDEVVIGQPSGGAAPGLPILADLSRRHAVVRREGGGYVLDPVGPTRLDGKEITAATALGDAHLIELGPSVRVRFSKPHALSATARLDVQSAHKTAPSADAVLLMADTCVLGPKKHSHVRCPDWKGDVVLFRQKSELRCRSAQPLLVDGREAGEAPAVDAPSRIEGQDFSMSVELA